jgi:hypothetical protein
VHDAVGGRATARDRVTDGQRVGELVATDDRELNDVLDRGTRPRLVRRAATLFATLLSTLTVKWTTVLPPLGTLTLLHVTVPLDWLAVHGESQLADT